MVATGRWQCDHGMTAARRQVRARRDELSGVRSVDRGTLCRHDGIHRSRVRTVSMPRIRVSSLVNKKIRAGEYRPRAPLRRMRERMKKAAAQGRQNNGSGV